MAFSLAVEDQAPPEYVEPLLNPNVSLEIPLKLVVLFEVVPPPVLFDVPLPRKLMLPDPLPIVLDVAAVKARIPDAPAP